MPTLPGRPAWVQEEDWLVAIGVHDRWHLQERARLRRAILATRGVRAGGRGVEGAVQRYRQFLASETRWYARFHLPPPEPELLGAVEPGQRPVEDRCAFCGGDWRLKASGRACVFCRRRYGAFIQRRRRAGQHFPNWRTRTACRRGHPVEPNRYFDGTAFRCLACLSSRRVQRHQSSSAAIA